MSLKRAEQLHFVKMQIEGGGPSSCYMQRNPMASPAKEEAAAIDPEKLLLSMHTSATSAMTSGSSGDAQLLVCQDEQQAPKVDLYHQEQQSPKKKKKKKKEGAGGGKKKKKKKSSGKTKRSDPPGNAEFSSSIMAGEGEASGFLMGASGRSQNQGSALLDDSSLSHALNEQTSGGLSSPFSQESGAALDAAQNMRHPAAPSSIFGGLAQASQSQQPPVMGYQPAQASAAAAAAAVDTRQVRPVKTPMAQCNNLSSHQPVSQLYGLPPQNSSVLPIIGGTTTAYQVTPDSIEYNIQSQEDVMRDLQSFTEDHMSVLTDQTGFNEMQHKLQHQGGPVYHTPNGWAPATIGMPGTFSQPSYPGPPPPRYDPHARTTAVDPRRTASLSGRQQPPVQTYGVLNDQFQPGGGELMTAAYSSTPGSNAYPRRQSQEDVMKDLQTFTEDHMSVLTEHTGFNDVYQYHNSTIGSGASLQSHASASLRRASFVSSLSDTEEVPHELLVNYMMAMGADREVAEQLAHSFAAEQLQNAQARAAIIQQPLPPAVGRHKRPAAVTLSSKLEEAERGGMPRSAYASDAKSVASFSITDQHSIEDPVYATNGNGIAYNGNSHAYSNGGKIVEAKPVEATAVKDIGSNLPIVYADTTPLSFKYFVSELPVRRFMCIGIVIVLAVMIGLVVYFVAIKESSTSGTSIATDFPSAVPSASPTVISDEILQEAAKLSGWNILNDRSSPQFRAVGWLSSVDQIDIGGLGRQGFAQRYALVVIYYSFKGEGWINQEAWLAPTLHECEWSGGIFCEYDATQTRSVTGFDATRNNLQGTIPSEIKALSSSQSFRIPKNNVVGTIPEAIGAMTSLVVMDFSDNKLMGSIPKTIGGARDLILLDLSNNELNSTMPDTIYTLGLLRTLTLKSNKLTGTLSQDLNDLKVLVSLDIRDNQISGTLPVTMDSIATLDIIRVDYNQMTGLLPMVTNALTRRQTITLSYNQFSGNVRVSSDYFLSPNMSDFRIQHIDLSYNKLSGPISPLFGFLPSFRQFDLSGNSFTGPFLSDVGWDNIEFLAAADNALTGTMPVGWPTLSK